MFNLHPMKESLGYYLKSTLISPLTVETKYSIDDEHPRGIFFSCCLRYTWVTSPQALSCNTVIRFDFYPSMSRIPFTAAWNPDQVYQQKCKISPTNSPWCGAGQAFPLKRYSHSLVCQRNIVKILRVTVC